MASTAPAHADHDRFGASGDHLPRAIVVGVEPNMWTTRDLDTVLEVSDRQGQNPPTWMVKGRVVEVRHYIDDNDQKWTRVVQEVGPGANRVKVTIPSDGE